jgi:TPR repeat protein
MGRYEMASVEMAAMGQSRPGPESFFELGMIYSAGREVAADLVAAHKWFNLAFLSGMRDAARYRAEVAREMTASEIADAQRAAREYLSSN